MRYVWSLPVDLAIVGIDNIAQLERNAALAAEFQPMARDRMAALEAATAQDEERINFYRRGSRGDQIRFAKDLVRRGQDGPVY
jgi:hypothetical protein